MNTVYQYLMSFGALCLIAIVIFLAIIIVGYTTFKIKNYFVGSGFNPLFNNLTDSFFEKIVTGVLIDLFIIIIFSVICFLFLLTYQLKLTIFGV